MDYTTNTTYAELATRLSVADRIALTSHEKPDGDALGSVLALKRLLDDRGRQADIFLVGPLEDALMQVAETTPYRLAEREPPGDDYDLIIVADTGAWSQLAELEGWLRRHHEIVIGFDHHRQGDDVAAARIVTPAAASTTVVLLPLVDALGVELTGEIGGVAEALFLGLATDSGWFRFSNADGSAFAAAARLLNTGVDKTRLYQLIEERHRPQRLALTARALASVTHALDGAVAMMTLRPDDFLATGGGLEDITNLVNAPMVLGSVRVSILLTELEDGRTKISFRSKPLLPEERGGPLESVIDVNRLARRFGGGGHVHAAGARVDRSLDQTMTAVLEALDTRAL